MRKILDYRCERTQHVFERFVEDTPTLRCNCGSNARRLISPVKCQLEGHSGAFPGRHLRWVREHEQAGRKGNDRA